jgi:hypothetical protein
MAQQCVGAARLGWRILALVQTPFRVRGLNLLIIPLTEPL